MTPNEQEKIPQGPQQAPKYIGDGAVDFGKTKEFLDKVIQGEIVKGSLDAHCATEKARTELAESLDRANQFQLENRPDTLGKDTIAAVKALCDHINLPSDAVPNSDKPLPKQHTPTIPVNNKSLDI